MNNFTSLLEKYIPKETIIVPMWGNHENFPISQFDFIGNKSEFLLDDAYSIW